MPAAVKTVLYPLITLAVILAAWYFGRIWFDVPSYVLPAPEAVWKALMRAYVEGIFLPHIAFTLQSTVLGYLAGCSIAIVLGAFLAESRTFERFVYPFVVALQSMPKVALAPLLIVWFGFGLESKVVMVGLICFFPLFINTMVGVRSTDPNLVDLMRAFSSSRLRIFFEVKLPSAAGHIFAGLQIAVVLALIGAVVSEFIASSKGLGNVIQAASVNMDVAQMFAALITLAAIGIAGSQLVRFAQRKVVFWERRAVDTGADASS